MAAREIRRPLATFFIALILSPFGCMLYLGRAWWAVFYFFAPVLTWVLDFAAWQANIRPLALADSLILSALLTYIVGICHCTVIAAKKRAKPDKWYARWSSIIIIVLVMQLAFTFAFRTYLYRPFDTPSASMLPTLKKGDYFFVHRFNKNNLQRGDIIVFENLKPHKAFYAKRIIGLPGDKISYVNGVFAINSNRAEQIKLNRDLYEETLPGGAFYQITIVNDGPIMKFPEVYVVPADSYFVVGDNRNNSLDSRFGEFGYVQKDNILGKVVIDFTADGSGIYTYKSF